jgi:hypothetical protein
MILIELEDLHLISRTITSKYKVEEIQSILLRHYKNISKIHQIIKVAIYIKLLKKNREHYSLNKNIESNSSLQIFSLEILNLLFKLDIPFSEIFSEKYMKYQSSYGGYVIRKTAFGVNFIQLLSLLESCNFLKQININDSLLYLINKEYLYFLDLKSPVESHGNLSVSRFDELLLLKQQYGKEAEEFVLNYEAMRLNNKNIEWVAKYIVDAGYDIASFDDENDTAHNRFIEVKSYDGEKEYFFWSRKELRVSRLKGIQYWIYLVNRSNMKNLNYEPTMIQNPFESVFNNKEWSKEPQSWKFELKDNA